MEKELVVVGSNRLEDIVEALLKAKERGEHYYFDFNGIILHSDTVTMDSAFKEVTGYTKKMVVR